jgi:hypothetical protein
LPCGTSRAGGKKIINTKAGNVKNQIRDQLRFNAQFGFCLKVKATPIGFGVIHLPLGTAGI